jgi:glycerol-3-phosphate dehydrogenase (NAD(P)+)
VTRAVVLGAGSWGTALASHLAQLGVDTVLWARRPEQAVAIREAAENRDYLPGIALPPGLVVTGNLQEAVAGRRLVLSVVPAQATRAILRQAAAGLTAEADLVIASKGIEERSGLRLTQVANEELPAELQARVGVLSGPSFAAEVAKGDPTAVVVAARDGRVAERVQATLSGRNLRVYRNADPIGIELGGALKNVIAIATGIVEGLGFGSNTRAALITRGLAETSRLGVALGGQAATFAGLAGMGDLVLTCTGTLSRNRALGVEIGRGRKLEEALAGTRTVAEGVATTRAVVALAAGHDVEMPIAARVAQVLFEARPPREAVEELLARPLKEEG